MIKLVIPAEPYLKSYTQAYDAYAQLGVSTYGMTDPRSCDIFERYDNYRQERNLKPNRVGADYYWLVDDGRDYFIGEITVEQVGSDISLLAKFPETWPQPLHFTQKLIFSTFSRATISPSPMISSPRTTTQPTGASPSS